MNKSIIYSPSCLNLYIFLSLPYFQEETRMNNDVQQILGELKLIGYEDVQAMEVQARII